MCLGKLAPDWFAQIQREAKEIVEAADYSDVGDKSHVTNWTRPTGKVQQFSLFNSSGRSGDYTGDYGAIQDTKAKRLVFPDKTAIARFAGLFGDRLRSLRLNGMGPSSGLNAHEEGSIMATPLGPRYIVRFHLPLFTNPDAWMYLDGERYHYDEGKLYFFHHGCVHAGTNDATMPRYHFVLDCFLNRDLYSRVFDPKELSPDAGFTKAAGLTRTLLAEPFRFRDFVNEGGVLRTDLNYGRVAPSALTYWRKNYPSVFGAPR